MKHLKIIWNDLKNHLMEQGLWKVYASFAWFIGGSALLHWINPWMEKNGMGTTSGAEPISMILITCIIGIIGFVGYNITSYIKSVVERAKNER